MRRDLLEYQASQAHLERGRQMAKERNFGANGAILYIIRHYDTFEFDVADVKD